MEPDTKMVNICHCTFLDRNIHILDQNDLKCDLIMWSWTPICIRRLEMDFPYSKTPKKWYHRWFYYFWFLSYLTAWLRVAAILEWSNMAAIAVAQLGSREKSKCHGNIYPWSKNGACGTIWTIIWLSPLTIQADLNARINHSLKAQLGCSILLFVVLTV